MYFVERIVVTKEELIAKVAEKSNISIDEADRVINAFTEQIKEQLGRGEKVTITGFGAFVLSKRGAKVFTNPKTGKKSDLPERTLPHFKAGGNFKKTLQK